MSERSVQDALFAALRGWKHHGIALLIVLIAFGFASLITSEVAYYAAGLVAFTIWMAWFVFTGVQFLRALDR